MRRKLFYYVLVFMAGILATHITTKFILALILIFGLCCWIYLRSKVNEKHIPFILGLCFFVGMLTLWSADFSFQQGNLAKIYKAGDTVLLQGKVVQVDMVKEEHNRLVVRIGGELLLCNFYENIDQPWRLLGRQITFSCKVNLPEEAGNPRCFDYGLYLKSEGIGYVSTIEQFEITDYKVSLMSKWKAYILQKRENYMTALNLSEEAEGMVRGVLFGDSHKMEEEIYNAFRKNGTAHVLAVSGLHVGMIYGIYHWLEQKLRTRWITIFFLLFLFIYGTATLWSVSVTRAIFLICLSLLGRKLDRRYDLLSALSAVAFVVLLRNPYAIFGAGFQMSFLAVTAMIFFQPPMERLVGKALAPSVAVQIGLLPYMAYVFNYVSFTGLVCNLPVVFLVSILVPMGMAGFCIFFLLELILPLFPQILGGLSQLTLLVNHLFLAEGILSFDVVSPKLWQAVLLYGLAFYLTSEHAKIYFGRRQWKKALFPIAILLIAVAVSVYAGSSPFDQANVTFVDVGQGDCVHFRDEKGRSVLIDGGGNINYNVGEKTLKPYLLKNGVDRLDLAAATHFHTDHYLGLEQLDACYPIEQWLTKGTAGDIIQFSEKQWLEILWPLDEHHEAEDENLNSLIFMLHDHGMKVLITGDITAEGEKMLVETYKGTGKLQAQVLKIAHHGSAYSTCDAFLDEVKPSIGVISVGQNNYGHPSEIVIEKLKKRGIMVFITDLDGAVGIIHRKGTISVCTKKQR